MLNPRGVLRRVFAFLYWKVNSAVNARFAQSEPLTAAGLPLPPPRMITAVAGVPDVRWYMASGYLASQDIRAALTAVGASIEDFDKILDFGCGSGRVIRYWRGTGPGVCGTDYNSVLINWNREHLPFTFGINDLDPPLAYRDGAFDFVYALSVFTHFDEQRQFAWRDELARVLRPGGYLLLTTHGTRFLGKLTSKEKREAFAAGRFVHTGDDVGSNTFAAFHPEPYVRTTLATANLSVAGFFPWGSAGQGGQDIWLFRKEPCPPDASRPAGRRLRWPGRAPASPTP
jgi:SAM-dependent methyltransferase